MTTIIDAIYEHGKLVLPRPLSLPEKSHVRVTIETGDLPTDDLLNKTRRNQVLRELETPMDGLVADIWEKLGPPPDVDYDKL